MARNTSEALTEREAEVMDAVWRLGEATAEQVRESLPGSPHDSTVRTLLRILEAKGYVTHEARGKVYVYRAAVERQQGPAAGASGGAEAVLRGVGRGPGAPADRGRADHPRAARQPPPVGAPAAPRRRRRKGETP